MIKMHSRLGAPEIHVVQLVHTLQEAIMTARLSDIARIDWGAHVPNSRGQLAGNDIENLKFIIQRIESTGKDKNEILSKCWKYISSLDSVEDIVAATKTILGNYRGTFPNEKVKFADGTVEVPFHELKLVHRVAPDLNLKNAQLSQFKAIISILYGDGNEVASHMLNGLNHLLRTSNAKLLKGKIEELRQRKADDITNAAGVIENSKFIDWIYMYTALPPTARAPNFDKLAEIILANGNENTAGTLAPLLKTFNNEERDRFKALMVDHLKDKDDKAYFFWHDLVNQCGFYATDKPEDGIPAYAMAKLKEKSEYLRTRAGWENNKPIDPNFLYALLNLEYPGLVRLPHPDVPYAEIMDFLSQAPPDDFKTAKRNMLDACDNLIGQLNPKNRNDLIFAVDVANFLSDFGSDKCRATLKQMFNKEIDEGRELTIWEKILSSLVSFFGRSIDEWIQVDRAFLFNKLGRVRALDLDLSPSRATPELWEFIRNHTGLRSLDLRRIPDILPETIKALPLTLEHLNISHNHALDDTIVDPICNMKNLKSLNIYDTRLSPEAKVKLLCHVEPIDLSGVELTDELIEQIPLSTKSLILGAQPKLTQNALAHLKKLTELEHLSLGSIPGIKLDSFYEVISLPRMRHLTFTYLRFLERNFLEKILHESKVKTLKLNYCQIEKEIYKRDDSPLIVEELVLDGTRGNFLIHNTILKNLQRVRLIRKPESDAHIKDLAHYCNQIVVPNQDLKSYILINGKKWSNVNIDEKRIIIENE